MIILKKKEDNVLSKDFQLSLDNKLNININLSNFYTGKVKNDKTSFINGYIASNSFEGEIYAFNNYYQIERADKYINYFNQSENLAIIYNEKDVDIDPFLSKRNNQSWSHPIKNIEFYKKDFIKFLNEEVK